MDKKGFEIGKFMTLLLALIAVVVIVSFITGGFGWTKNIVNAITGRTNQSVGEVLKSWEDLTPGEKEKLNEEQKADLLLKSAKAALDSGVAKQNIDDLKKAKNYADQVLAIATLSDTQRTQAKTIADTAQKYITELSVANLLAQATYQTNRNELVSLYEKCVRDFGYHIGSVECIAKLFLLQHADKKGEAFGNAVQQDLGMKLAAAQNAQERARILLAEGVIFESAASNDPEYVKEHLANALSKYTLLTADPRGEFRSLPDYVGRAYHRKANIYLYSPNKIGLTFEEGKRRAFLEYENLFRKLGTVEFLDRRKAEEVYKGIGFYTAVVSMKGVAITPRREFVSFTKEERFTFTLVDLPKTIVLLINRDAVRPFGADQLQYVDNRPAYGPRFSLRVLHPSGFVLCDDSMTDVSGRDFLFLFANEPSRKFTPPSRVLSGLCRSGAHVDLLVGASNVSPAVEGDEESFTVQLVPVADTGTLPRL